MEQDAGLGIIIVILSMVPVISRPFQAEGRFSKVRLLLPLAVTIRLVSKGAAIVAVNPHGSITVIAVKWASRGIDRDQMMVHTEPIALGIAVGE